ncbi:MAG: GNAT family N-acetyltransferase [Myxococcaceae bacterium]
MKTVALRPALKTDLALLRAWMVEFRAREGLAPRALPAELPLAGAFVLTTNGGDAGYAVITRAGRDAFLTELFLRAEARRLGLGVRVMELLQAEARRGGARALHLLLGEHQHAARQVDARRGFLEPKRLTLGKAPRAA